MNIFLKKNGVQTGPYSEAQIQEMLKAGELSPDETAWDDDTPEWQPLHEMLGLSRLPSSASAPSTVAGTSSPQSTMTGVGGWLLVFCLILTVVAPLRTIVEKVTTNQMDVLVVADRTSWKRVLVWEDFGSAVIVIYGFIVGCIIWKGHPRGRDIALRFLKVRLVAIVWIEVIAVLLEINLPAEQFGLVLSAGLMSLFGALGYTLLWSAYFKKSVRVRNTYGPEA